MPMATRSRRALTVLSAGLMALPLALVPTTATAAEPESPRYGTQAVCEIVADFTPFYYDWTKRTYLGTVHRGQKFNTIQYTHGGYDGRLWGREWEVVWIDGTRVGCWT